MPERPVAGPGRRRRLLWLSGASKASLEKARMWAVATCESCSLDRGTMGEPSRSCHGEGQVLRIGTRSRSGHGTGETRLRSLVSKDRSYKPMVKSDGAQRESGRVVVPARDKVSPAVGKSPRLWSRRQLSEVSARAWPGLPSETLWANLRPRHFEQWTREFFWQHGLHRLRATVRYPEAA